jgi:hypothetical protein
MVSSVLGSSTIAYVFVRNGGVPAAGDAIGQAGGRSGGVPRAKERSKERMMREDAIVSTGGRRRLETWIWGRDLVGHW